MAKKLIYTEQKGLETRDLIALSALVVAIISIILGAWDESGLMVWPGFFGSLDEIGYVVKDARKWEGDPERNSI